MPVYYANDAGAPSLSGSVGALIGVLDACLVNGYGAKSAAGWTKEFSGVNKAVYKQGSGNLMRLRVDDSGATDALLRGFASMSDVDTGTDLFPTTVQSTNGCQMTKSDTASTATRNWILFADNKKFVLWVGHAQVVGAFSNTAANPLMFFGDIDSYKIGDAYHTALIAQSSAGYSNSQMAKLDTLGNPSTGHYLCRSYTGIGGSVTFGKHTDYVKSNGGTVVGTTGLTYPDSVSGGLLMAPLWLHESNSSLRGILPKLWAPLHNLNTFNAGDTFDGTGDLVGKTFIQLQCGTSGSAGKMLVETTGW